LKDYRKRLEFLVAHKIYGPFSNYDGLIQIYFTTDQPDTPEGKAQFFKMLKATQEKVAEKRLDFFEIIAHTQRILDVLESCEGEKDKKVLLSKMQEMIKLYNE
jgi:hypothetical protein